jgi:hypothetical protein
VGVTINSRMKGKRTELELVHVLQAFFPDARRYLEQCRTQSGRDIDGTPGFCFQLKAGKVPSWRKAYTEAAGSAGSDVPVGVTRENRDEFMVHLTLTDFLHLCRWGER